MKKRYSGHDKHIICSTIMTSVVRSHFLNYFNDSLLNQSGHVCLIRAYTRFCLRFKQTSMEIETVTPLKTIDNFRRYLQRGPINYIETFYTCCFWQILFKQVTECWITLWTKAYHEMIYLGTCRFVSSKKKKKE